VTLRPVLPRGGDEAGPKFGDIAARFIAERQRDPKAKLTEQTIEHAIQGSCGRADRDKLQAQGGRIEGGSVRGIAALIGGRKSTVHAALAGLLASGIVAKVIGGSFGAHSCSMNLKARRGYSAESGRSGANLWAARFVS